MRHIWTCLGAIPSPFRPFPALDMVEQCSPPPRTPLHRNRRESTRFHAFLTRCYLVLGPHTSQLRVRRVPRYSGSISSPGLLSYQPDDGSSSPFALAGSPRPETTSISPEGSLASKTTKYVSSGGNHYHPALLSPNRTPAEPWAHSERRNEATTALGHTENEGAGNQFGVWKGKDRLASETPHIVAWDHVATEAPAHSMNKPTHQSVASGSTKPYTPDEEIQVPLVHCPRAGPGAGPVCINFNQI